MFLVSKTDDLLGPGRSRAFSPYLAPEERERLREMLDFGDGMPPSFASELRSLAKRYIDDGDSLKLRAVCLLVADLCDQGWHITIEQDRIAFEPPGIGRKDEEEIEDVKARVRKALESARHRQLQKPSVRKFLARMERRTRRPQGKFSVLDLIDDGADLGRELSGIRDLGAEDRDRALAELIDPVVEVCAAGAKCTETGLALNDIWRYFRHTWAHEYRPIPGRQMLVLIRNAARPRCPIIGIAMLASPVMRLSIRDKWIGWLRESAEERIRDGVWDPAELGRALFDRINNSIDMVRWDDLAGAQEIDAPTETVVLRLQQKAAGAAFARERELREYYEEYRSPDGRVKPHRGQLKTASADADWRAASEDLLFVRKRAESLANLLFAKRVFHEASLSSSPVDALQHLLSTRDGCRALDIAFTEFRKAGLSSEVADVSICGAVHPYNELLGGKLVTLLLTSQEVRDAYAERYGGQVSVIASQMAGRAVLKPANLRVLTTTSLYGVGSSQYNRLVLRAADHPELEFDVAWGAIGKSLTGGFGTLHLGVDTAQALRSMAITRHDSRRVNNRFGEGTSPRLRQIREGLDALGLKSDTILHHATPRIFYGCELVPGARDALVDTSTPMAASPSVKVLATAWRRRWLSKRIMRDETLEGLTHLGETSIRARLHADADGQFLLPIGN